MQTRRFTSPAEFAAVVTPYLMQNEAEHNLMVGLCSRLMHPSTPPPGVDPYLAVVQQANEIYLVAIMTPPHNLLISHIADTLAIPHLIRDLYRFEHHPPGVAGTVEDSLAIARAWQGITGQAFLLAIPERIYQLTQVIPVRNVRGSLRAAVESDRPLLIDWASGFIRDAFHEEPTEAVKQEVNSRLTDSTHSYYLWEVNHKPVSMAGCAGPTPNGIRINNVYTPPEHRRRGYASACVAALSQLLLDSGYQFCFLYTDLNNPTSNHIYQGIGYVPVCDVNVYRFTNPT